MIQWLTPMRANTIAMLNRFGKKNFEWLYLGNGDFIRIEYARQFFPKINLKKSSSRR